MNAEMFQDLMGEILCGLDRMERTRERMDERLRLAAAAPLTPQEIADIEAVITFGHPEPVEEVTVPTVVLLRATRALRAVERELSHR